MCGIAGYLTPGPSVFRPEHHEKLLAPIRLRGPDDEGACLISRSEGVVQALHTDRSTHTIREGTVSLLDREAWINHDLAFFHTRYAVIDPSARSHQPFITNDGSVVVAFQGEIFNYPELRKELEALGFVFSSRGDTEVLAHAFRAWGDDSWKRLNGQWAAAVFDRRASRLVLSRDRLGIAPLFLSISQDPLAFIFGSSVSGLAGFRAQGASPNRSRVRDFIETGLKDFDEETLFDGVWSLKPGTFLSFPSGIWRPTQGRKTQYWLLPAKRLGRNDLSLEEAASTLRGTLSNAVEYRLRANLPVAFQLSGGLDSTSVLALSSQFQAGPIPTYTVSVPEVDEEPLARLMANRFRLEPHVLSGPEEGLVARRLDFARLLEEPVQGPGAYGHFLLCEGVKRDGFGVVISGSGGDEALAGYEWDFWPAAWSSLMADGRVGQALLYHLFIRYGSWKRAKESTWGWVRWLRRLPYRTLSRSTRLRGAEDDPRAHGNSPRGAERARSSFRDLDFDARQRFHLQIADLPYYLASNDKATLGIPIEHRQPFLDHRVVELGLRLPVSYLFHRGWTKYVLRKAMEPLLPKEILWRREKLGFPFPTRRFLEDNRSIFHPITERVGERGFHGPAGPSYTKLLGEDSNRLWRICSVGLWMDALTMD